MLTTQLTIKGNVFYILPVGDDNEKEAFINLCYNWHIISRLPEYDSEPLQSDRKRLYRGLLMQAMSKHEVLTNQMRHKAFRGKATRCIVEVAHTVKAWLHWKRVSVVMPEETLADTLDDDTTQTPKTVPSKRKTVSPKTVTPTEHSVAIVERCKPLPKLAIVAPVSVVSVESQEENEDGLTEEERKVLALFS